MLNTLVDYYKFILQLDGLPFEASLAVVTLCDEVAARSVSPVARKDDATNDIHSNTGRHV